MSEIGITIDAGQTAFQIDRPSISDRETRPAVGAIAAGPAWLAAASRG